MQQCVLLQRIQLQLKTLLSGVVLDFVCHSQASFISTLSTLLCVQCWQLFAEKCCVVH